MDKLHKEPKGSHLNGGHGEFAIIHNFNQEVGTVTIKSFAESDLAWLKRAVWKAHESKRWVEWAERSKEADPKLKYLLVRPYQQPSPENQSRL